MLYHPLLDTFVCAADCGSLSRAAEKLFLSPTAVKKQLDSLEKARWYVQDRTSLSSYSNLSSDTASIEALGIMFPVIFLTVAVLIDATLPVAPPAACSPRRVAPASSTPRKRSGQHS